MTKSGRELSTLMWCIGTLILLFVVGGAVFSWLERDAELDHYRRNRFLYEQMKEMYEFDKCKDDWFQNMEFCKRQEEFNKLLKTFFERNGNEMEDHYKWTFFGSAFFVSTLVTTLGFGNFHPRTEGGQLFAVVLGLVGIPLMGYVLSHVGRFVVEVWMPMCPTIETRTRRLVVLCSLMVLLVLCGGFMFRFMEGWSFLESCYFSACTLMSVGFGDYLPSQGLPRLCTMVYILFGLGVGASFIALLQIHVEVKGESFARYLTAGYDAVTDECSRGNNATALAVAREAQAAHPDSQIATPDAEAQLPLSQSTLGSGTMSTPASSQMPLREY